MLIQLRRAVVLVVVAVALTFAYAFAGTGVSQLLFKHQANGSITADGSTLIGQNWSSPKWFHGRPDDTGPYAANPKATPPVGGGDNPLVANGNSGSSGASNLGPRSKVLLTNTQALVAYDVGQRL
jgi:potassium-transporting ATPase KdpC subunit